MKRLVYFSHSYRWEEKELNREIWALLEQDFNFVVDPPGQKRRPMDVTQLENMMRRSSCFIAVIPRRRELRPECSPYQLFENGLAVRANRPRLLIVDESIERQLFGPSPDVYISFTPMERWSTSPNAQYNDSIKNFSSIVQGTDSKSWVEGRQIGLLLPRNRDYPAGDMIWRLVTKELERPAEWIDISETRNDYDLIAAFDRCSLVIAELRGSFIPPDIIGILHQRCVPTIRICYLHKKIAGTSLRSNAPSTKRGTQSYREQ